MAYYFIGGEDSDFGRIGVAVVNTALTAARRTANARCSLRVEPVTGAGVNDGWQGAFTTTAATFWFTARMYATSWAASTAGDLMMFLDGTVRRLGLKNDSSGHLLLFKRNAAGTNTTLVTSTNVLSVNTLLKLDVQVSYGASNTCNVYVDGVLWMTFTGDVTTDSATTLNGFVIGISYPGVGATYWSEVICGTDDTRGFSLITLPPAANGNTFAWSNSFASLDEVTLDDADLCTSSAANDIAETTVTSSGITGTPAVRAVCVAARAQKGATGPQNIQAMVRTGGADYVSGTIALATSFNRIANIFETNPGTAVAWLSTDLTAVGFNIGIKSIT